MAEFLPFLQITNPATGLCFNLVDNCLTLSRLKPRPEFDTLRADCEECCPSCLDESPYSGDAEKDGAFWGGRDGPGSDTFLGLLVSSVSVEPSTSERRRGGPGEEQPDYTPRTMEIQGRLYSTDSAGTYFAESTLVDLLSRNCGGCDLELSVFPFCPENERQDVIFEEWQPDLLPDLTGDEEDCCGPCEREDPDYEPNVLGPSIFEPFDVDNGRRNLMRARFRSFDVADEDAILYCHGRDVTFVFEILDDYEWGDEIEGCSIQLASEFERCRPPDWSKCLMITEPASCEDETAEPGGVVEGARPDQVDNSAICTPLYRSVKACLTPTLETSGSIGLGFQLWAGSSDLRNLKIDVYPAYHNWPSPDTCKGEELYSNIQPCTDPFEVGFIAAGSVMTLDPRTGQIEISCPGAAPQRGEHLTGGWTFPVFDFSCRYWIKITADCFNTAEDAELDLSFFPRWAT